MRLSRFHLVTTREVPADAEVASHRLMLRAGMIRKLASGIYVWSPLGLRVLRKVEAVVREELTRAGAIEMLMPSVQPRELWEESGRWNKYGPGLLKFHDRRKQDFCYGPTHEEVICEFARNELRSYKQLPITFFQIQTKFRDEIRPRFGVMRSREFIMQDAYSFHLDQASLDATYDTMHAAYSRIFTRLGLSFRAVAADSGSIGGDVSHEFQVLADSGEDAIAFSDESDYAANVELAEALAPDTPPAQATATLERIETPSQKTVPELGQLLHVAPAQCIKTLLVQGQQGLVALCVRGDHELNAVKAGKLPELSGSLRPADAHAVETATGAPPDFVGPVGLPEDIPVIVDRSAAVIANFVCGGNREGTHYTGASWDRDARVTRIADLRKVVAGDRSPDGRGSLRIARGIEVGQVFQNGVTYTRDMGVKLLGEDGKQHTPTTGCYGIGITRTVAAAIEQHHDERGIIWPEAMAPWHVAICVIARKERERVLQAAMSLHDDLTGRGIDVVVDDRGLRPGAMFADMELLGIPHRIVVSERGLEAGTFEYRARQDTDSQTLTLDELLALSW